MNVSIKRESAPGNTFSSDDMEMKLKDAENWTVLPADETHNYLPIHEIMKNQTDDMDNDIYKSFAEWKCIEV